VGADLVLDTPLPPETALRGLRTAIQQRPRRAFGVVKVRNEFVGVVTEDGFEVWERRQRAVRAVGQARRHRGGSRIEVRFRLSPVSRVAIGIFFALYAAAAAGIAYQPPANDISGTDVAIAAAGAAVFAAFFYAASRRQRRDLAGFLTNVLTAGPP
jgi:hypothetical protein